MAVHLLILVSVVDDLAEFEKLLGTLRKSFVRLRRHFHGLIDTDPRQPVADNDFGTRLIRSVGRAAMQRPNILYLILIEESLVAIH